MSVIDRDRHQQQLILIMEKAAERDVDRVQRLGLNMAELKRSSSNCT